jgi:aminoglycoside phosphotransferase (APT) family kinase protein
LEERLGIRGGIVVEQFPAGHSNLTYLLQAGDRELVLRRPPFGAEKIRKGHDMGREFRVLQGLSRVYPKVPKPLLLCEDRSVIGVPFYVMERVRGVLLRREPPPPSAVDLSPPRMRALSEAFVDNLVEIHGLDVEAAGLGDLGRPQGYVRRQVEGWAERYRRAQTDEIPEMERVARWLYEHIPQEEGAALIHNDYKYDNLVLDPKDLSIRAVLDWEMATVGDPLMDLGTSLGYWVEPDDPDELQRIRFCLTTLPGNLTRRELVERYAYRTGRALGPNGALFYYVYGLFKIAGIAQQIYFRYVQGLARDRRFAALIEGVRALARAAERAVQRGTI